jgi:hypothetical protein
MKKTRTKKFRLTEEDAERLAAHAEAAEMSESEYIRTLITDPSHVFTTEASTIKALYREAKRQGVNINMIARSANANKATPFDGKTLRSLAESNVALVRAVSEALGGRRR